MKAIVIDQPGGPEALKWAEYPTPEPAARELLVKVHFTALNRADIVQREGKYPPPAGASPLLGLEVAGEVVKKGAETSRFETGDRVFGLLPGGGYAEYAVIHEEMALPVPDWMTMEEAAAIPEVFLTAYQALKWLGKAAEGETVLIHAAASGVGTAALQLGRHMGLRLLGTASPGKHETCLGLGAEKVFDYQKAPFGQQVQEYTGGEGVDVIIDFIGGPYFSQNIGLLRRNGRLVILATLGGGLAEEVDVRRILARRLQVTGSTLRSRELEYQVRLTQEMAAFALPLFQRKEIMPVIDTVYPVTEVAEAHHYMESNENIGKILLKIH